MVLPCPFLLLSAEEGALSQSPPLDPVFPPALWPVLPPGEMFALANFVFVFLHSPIPGKAKAKPVVEKKVGPASVSRHRRVSSDEGRKLSPFLPPEMFQKLQTTQMQSPRK